MVHAEANARATMDGPARMNGVLPKEFTHPIGTPRIYLVAVLGVNAQRRERCWRRNLEKAPSSLR
jgi:hypothetical protein